MHMDSFEMMLFMMSLISIGALIGICFEILNYRREIRDHIGYLEEIRMDVASTALQYAEKLEKLDAKVETIDMMVNNKR